MTDMAKTKKTLKTVLSFLIPVAVLAAIVMSFVFVNTWYIPQTKENAVYDMYFRYISSIKTTVAELSGYEAGLYEEDDVLPHAIPQEGEMQEYRDDVFDTCYSAETYVSSVTGKRCARYKYSSGGIGYVVIYDPSDITRHPAESEKYAYIDEHILLIRGEEDYQ